MYTGMQKHDDTQGHTGTNANTLTRRDERHRDTQTYRHIHTEAVLITAGAAEGRRVMLAFPGTRT